MTLAVVVFVLAGVGSYLAPQLARLVWRAVEWRQVRTWRADRTAELRCAVRCCMSCVLLVDNEQANDLFPGAQ